MIFADGHSCVIMHNDKAIAIPITGSENSDQLTEIVQAALQTVNESEILTQGQI